MKVEMAEQYGAPCLVIEEGDEGTILDDIVARAWRDECTYFDGEDHLIVARLPGRPQEVYTEEALRRSLKP